MKLVTKLSPNTFVPISNQTTLLCNDTTVSKFLHPTTNWSPLNTYSGTARFSGAGPLRIRPDAS